MAAARINTHSLEGRITDYDSFPVTNSAKRSYCPLVNDICSHESDSLGSFAAILMIACHSDPPDKKKNTLGVK